MKILKPFIRSSTFTNFLVIFALYSSSSCAFSPLAPLRLGVAAASMSAIGSGGSDGTAPARTAMKSVENNSADASDEVSGSETSVPLLGMCDESDSSIPTIKMGEVISLEEMGPIILNTDGTTRRIDNWDTMTKSEQEVAWRRISKRNKKRKEILMEQLQLEEESNAPNKD